MVIFCGCFFAGIYLFSKAGELFLGALFAFISISSGFWIMYASSCLGIITESHYQRLKNLLEDKELMDSDGRKELI